MPYGGRTPFADWIRRDVAEAGGSTLGLRRNLGLMSASGLAPTSVPKAVFATVALFSTKLARLFLCLDDLGDEVEVS